MPVGDTAGCRPALRSRPSSPPHAQQFSQRLRAAAFGIGPLYSRLGRSWANTYGDDVTGFLRFVGLINAAVWLGGAIFYTLGVAPALVSQDMVNVLRPENFPFFSGAISQVVLKSYFHLHLACAVLALLHLVVEWLYLGRAARGIWTYLLITLLGASLIGTFWLSPKLRDLHRTQHLLKAAPGQREAAAQSFRIWQGCFQGLNVLMIAGVAVYFWRAAHPPDDLRFVGSAKIRG